MSHRTTFAVWLGGIAVCFSGCANFGYPAPRSPGSLEFQRQRAALFDPYPSADIGPRIDDLRPRDFDRPSTETRQSRRFIESLTPTAGF